MGGLWQRLTVTEAHRGSGRTPLWMSGLSAPRGFPSDFPTLAGELPKLMRAGILRHRRFHSFKAQAVQRLSEPLAIRISLRPLCILSKNHNHRP